MTRGVAGGASRALPLPLCSGCGVGAALVEQLDQVVGVGEVAVVGQRDRAGGRGPERRLRVLPDAGAGRAVARVADRDRALERLERRLVEDLRDEAHVLVDEDLAAVAHRDAGRFLPAVLQGVEAEVGELGDFLAGSPDAEHAAGVLGSDDPGGRGRGSDDRLRGARHQCTGHEPALFRYGAVVLTAFLYGLATARPAGDRSRHRPALEHPAARARGRSWRSARGTLVAAASEELFGPAFESMAPCIAGAGADLSAPRSTSWPATCSSRVSGAASVGWALMLRRRARRRPGEHRTRRLDDRQRRRASGGDHRRQHPRGDRQRGHALRDDPDIGAAAGLLMWVGGRRRARRRHRRCPRGHGRRERDEHRTAAQAFAGGATIAVLADTLIPKAYKEGGWWVGLATAFGFLVAYVLG